MPPHDFADQAIRAQLEHPANLRDLLHAVLGDLADGFRCEEREILPREFPLEDWRHRESDLLFRIPYQTPLETIPVLICVLIEHQSQPDPLMPLRTLLYTVFSWEREWKVWEALEPPRPPLRLTPVVPIVFHTGKRKWRKHRTLASLIGGPAPFARYAPKWTPLFLDLGPITPEALLQMTACWFNALAVVRADNQEAEAFRHILQDALRRLEGLAETEPARWRELLHFVLQWALYRRPNEERAGLIESAKASQSNALVQQEVQSMGQTIAEALIAEGEAKGIEKGEAKGRLTTEREWLQAALEAKFGPVPDVIRKQIQSATDHDRLRTAFLRVQQLGSLEEFEL